MIEMNNMKIIRNFDDLNEKDYPQYLYKYRCWDGFYKRVLEDNELYIPSPCSFDDDMDCNLEEQFPKKGKELYSFFISKCKELYPSKNREERREFAQKWCHKSPMADTNYRNQIIHNLKDEFDKKFGVLSLSLTYENEYMWENYANQKKGFCLGFHTKILLDTNFFSGGGRVQYYDKLPYIDFEKDDILTKFNKNIFSKRKNPYSQELEYRLTKRWDEEVGDKERAYKFPIESLSQIILGKNISKTDKDEIYDIQKTKYPNAQIIYM